MSCPCGGGPSLDECCGPYISGDKKAASAETLMRSRYTAYVVENIDYIVTTHVEEGREEIDREAAAKWAKEAEWTGLEIVATQNGGENDTEGGVEFIARYKVDGAELDHHEHSHFKKVGDEWFYLDGHMIRPKPVVRDSPKIGRNEPCPCGSGKKYKKCCAA